MLVTIHTKNPTSMGMSVGEYDVQKKKLFLHFSRTSAKEGTSEVKFPQFEVPKDVKEVEFHDRDWDGIYTSSVKHLKALKSDSDFVYFDFKHPDVKRLR